MALHSLIMPSREFNSMESGSDMVSFQHLLPYRDRFFTEFDRLVKQFPRGIQTLITLHVILPFLSQNKKFKIYISDFNLLW